MNNSEHVLYTAMLQTHHEITGNTKHFRHGNLLGKPHELRLVQYHGDPGVYLIRYDATGAELTDTYHETIEQAFIQAEWEYTVRKNEWLKVCEV